MLNEKSIDIRERAYDFALSIVKLSKSFPNKNLYWIISDQLLRSATSIGANLIEAKGAHSTKDYIKFFQISLKSANETEYWLRLLKDAGDDVDKDIIEVNLKEIAQLIKMISASVVTLKKKLKT